MANNLPDPYDSERLRELREAHDMPVPQQATFVGGCCDPNPSSEQLGYVEDGTKSRVEGDKIGMYNSNNGDGEWLSSDTYVCVDEMN